MLQEAISRFDVIITHIARRSCLCFLVLSPRTFGDLKALISSCPFSARTGVHNIYEILKEVYASLALSILFGFWSCLLFVPNATPYTLSFIEPLGNITGISFDRKFIKANVGTKVLRHALELMDLHSPLDQRQGSFFRIYLQQREEGEYMCGEVLHPSTGRTAVLGDFVALLKGKHQSRCSPRNLG